MCLVPLMLLSSLSVAAAPARTCSLSGKVEFRPPADSKVKLEQVVVFVAKKPKLAELDEEASFEIEQKNIQFNPRIRVAQELDQLSFPNRDQEAHSVWARGLFNIKPTTQKAPEPQSVRKSNDSVSVRLQCDIHKQMRAEILVIPVRRFHAFVKADGSWRIDGLPDETITLSAWEPNGGKVDQPHKVNACGGASVTLTLEGKPEPKMKRFDGSDYPPYDP